MHLRCFAGSQIRTVVTVLQGIFQGNSCLDLFSISGGGGALISNNVLKGGRLIKGGRLLEGGGVLNTNACFELQVRIFYCFERKRTCSRL